MDELLEKLEAAIGAEETELIDELRRRVIADDVERDWCIRDDEGGDTTISAASLNDARDAAEEWLRDGDWDTTSGPVYLTAYVDCELTGETSSVDVTIEVDEPNCVDNETHDWQSPHKLVGGITDNPGVWGNGGGVLIEEACMLCGCARHTNTWATDPRNGTQGVTEVTYVPNEYADQIPSRAERELDAINCEEMRRCAAHVLQELRNHHDEGREPLDDVEPESSERAREVATFALAVQRIDHSEDRRAVRLALWLAARNAQEALAAKAIMSAYVGESR